MESTALISLYEAYYDVPMPPPLKSLLANVSNINLSRMSVTLNGESYRIRMLQDDLADRYDGFFTTEVREQFAASFQTTEPIIFAECLPVSAGQQGSIGNKNEDEEAGDEETEAYEEEEEGEAPGRFFLAVFPAPARHRGDFARFHDTSIVYPVYLCYGDFPTDAELLEEYDLEDLGETNWGMQEFVPDLRQFTAYICPSS